MILSACVATDIVKSLLYNIAASPIRIDSKIVADGILIQMLRYNNLYEYYEPLKETLSLSGTTCGFEGFKKKCGIFCALIQAGFNRGISEETLSNIWIRCVRENRNKNILDALVVDIAKELGMGDMSYTETPRRIKYNKELYYDIYNDIRLNRENKEALDNNIELIIDNQIRVPDKSNQNKKLALELADIAILLYNYCRVGSESKFDSDAYIDFEAVVAKVVAKGRLSKEAYRTFFNKIIQRILADGALRYDVSQYKQYLKELIPPIAEDVETLRRNISKWASSNVNPAVINIAKPDTKLQSGNKHRYVKPKKI